MMHSTNKTALALIRLCLFMATFVGGGVAMTSAIAQERSESDGERGDSDDRRERYRSWRRNRGESGSDERERRQSSTEREDEKLDDAPSMGMTDYAKGLIKKYDKNGNMMLDGDERRALRPPASLADANNDNVITTEELVTRLSSPASKSSSAPSSPSTASTSESSKDSSDGDAEKDDDSDRRGRERGSFSGSRRGDRDQNAGRSEVESKGATTSKRVLTWTGGGAKAGDAEKTVRRTYRFTPAGERVPTGLPSWFKSQDKNGDGQVAMSEYSRSWSKSTVAKFRGYDLNDDGVITAKEAGK